MDKASRGRRTPSLPMWKQLYDYVVEKVSIFAGSHFLGINIDILASHGCLSHKTTVTPPSRHPSLSVASQLRYQQEPH